MHKRTFLEAIERLATSQDWITLLLLGVFILLASVKAVFSQRFGEFAMLFATNKYLLLRGKDTGIFHPFNVVMFVVNAISVSLFIYILYITYSTEVIERPKVLFLRILTAYTTFVLLKFSLEKITANILDIDERIEHFLFYKLSYRNFLALMLLPVNVFFIYAWKPSLTVLYVCIGIILLLNFIIVAGILKKNQQYILSNGFYFILYLCALEIGPYFILYKLFTKL